MGLLQRTLAGSPVGVLFLPENILAHCGWSDPALLKTSCSSRVHQVLYQGHCCHLLVPIDEEQDQLQDEA